MSIHELKKYLKDILELEKQKLSLERIIHNITNKHFKSKYIGLEKKHICIGVYIREVSEKGIWSFLAVMGFFCGFLISKGNISRTLLGVLIAWAVGFCVIFSVILIINAKNNRGIVSRNAQIQKENEMRYKESCEKNKLLHSSANKLKKTYLKTEFALQKMYDLNILSQKYQNILAVSAIYGYLNSGKAASIEEAYDIYEEEIGFESGMIKMETILLEPEQIANNHYYLYSVIKDVKLKIDEFSNSIIENIDKLKQAAVNTAVKEYSTAVGDCITQIIERNQRCVSRE